jgi:hypothetical protein
VPFRPRLVAIPLLVLGAVGVVVTPASAAALTYTVKVGTATSGAATITLAKTGSGDVTFFDPDAGISPISCSAISSTLTTTLSTAAKGTKLAKLGGTKVTTCESRDGTVLDLTAKGTWAVAAVGATTSSGATLVISKVQIAVKAPGGACSYNLKGTLSATYDNSGSLTFNFDTAHILVLSKYVGGSECEVANGQRMALLVTETVTATKPTGAFSITSN